MQWQALSVCFYQSRLGRYDELIVSVVKFTSFFRAVYHILRGLSNYEYDELEELILIQGGKQRPSREQFSHDTSEAPHVDCLGVWQAHEDLGCAVVPGLHVGEAGLAVEAAGAKVDHLKLISLIIGEQDVFRLEVAVDDPCHFLQEVQAVQDLL